MQNLAALPIGYWIKKVDELLTAQINETHQRVGLSRPGWQLIHQVCTKPAQPAASWVALIAPFATAQEAYQHLRELTDRGLLAWDGEPSGWPKATAEGEQLHNACFIEQQKVRQRAMRAITEEQYMATVQTLQQIVANLS